VELSFRFFFVRPLVSPPISILFLLLREIPPSPCFIDLTTASPSRCFSAEHFFLPWDDLFFPGFTSLRRRDKSLSFSELGTTIGIPDPSLLLPQNLPLPQLSFPERSISLENASTNGPPLPRACFFFFGVLLLSLLLCVSLLRIAPVNGTFVSFFLVFFFVFFF